MIINPSAIGCIEILPHMYSIHLMSSPFEGGMFFGSGSIGSSRIEITMDKFPEDHRILSKWIKDHVPEMK
jgi:hypothetical protein